jgi:hypothetical protein
MLVIDFVTDYLLGDTFKAGLYLISEMGVILRSVFFFSVDITHPSSSEPSSDIYMLAIYCLLLEGMPHPSSSSSEICSGCRSFSIEL